MMRIFKPSAVAFFALALALRAPWPVRAAEYRMTIEDMKFGEVPAGLRAGDIIIWHNSDIVRHSVTARDKSFDLERAAGAEGRIVLSKTGIVEFYCKFHPTMKGKLDLGP